LWKKSEFLGIMTRLTQLTWKSARHEQE